MARDTAWANGLCHFADILHHAHPNLIHIGQMSHYAALPSGLLLLAEILHIEALIAPHRL